MRTHRTLSKSSWIDENVKVAEVLFKKWDSALAAGTSLFFADREDVKQYLKSAKDLQAAMHYLVSEHKSSKMFAHGQSLMQTAMKRLEKEFYQILSPNRDNLGQLSTQSSRPSEMSSFTSDLEDYSEDEFHFATPSATGVKRVSTTAMADLKSIADGMISAEHDKECIKIYNIFRKSIIDEVLYRLGFERLSFHQVHHMDWEVLEKKIKIWLKAVKTAIGTIFEGERILCVTSSPHRTLSEESCFREISKEGAMNKGNEVYSRVQRGSLRPLGKKEERTCEK